MQENSNVNIYERMKQVMDENSKSEPNEQLIHEFCKAYDVNPNWLRTGYGKKEASIKADERKHLENLVRSLVVITKTPVDENLRDFSEKYVKMSEEDQRILVKAMQATGLFDLMLHNFDKTNK